jgi:hypothetical protein
MKTQSSHRRLLEERLGKPICGRLQARTTLRHFALVNYLVPREKLEPLIPCDRFEPLQFETSRGAMSFLSVVAFFDEDFHFPKLMPAVKFNFYQTNHRIYVTDKKSGQPAVWFFGTNLGSRLVSLPRMFWKIPWHHSRYEVDCRFNPASGRYEKYSYHFTSSWCSGEVEINDTGEPIGLEPGFDTLDEMKLILTHPIHGYYRRLDGKIGTYEIRHPEMNCTRAVPKKLYFSLYENLGLMSKTEMQQPHSIFLCPEIKFDIQLPPQIVRQFPICPGRQIER